MFLAMDTVFEQCSIAILDANGQVLSSHTEQGKREQTQHIFERFGRGYHPYFWDGLLLLAAHYIFL